MGTGRDGRASRRAVSIRQLPALGIYGVNSREQLQDKNFFELVHPQISHW
jgi:hypothetical protein